VLELNEFTFGHLTVSIEFIFRAMVRIMDYLKVDLKYPGSINSISRTMATELLQK
jgi:hypothetical protein